MTKCFECSRQGWAARCSPVPLSTSFAVWRYAPLTAATSGLSLTKLRPCRPPLLRFFLLVPVGSGNGFAFVLPLLRVIEFIPGLVKNVLLFLLRSPLAALVKRAHSPDNPETRGHKRLSPLSD